MLYPYMTLDDETEIVHSEMDAEGRVRVCIERPVEGGFQSATCTLPSYSWSEVEGFNEDELRQFQDIIEQGAHLIIRYAQNGGFLNAGSRNSEWCPIIVDTFCDVGTRSVTDVRPVRTPCGDGVRTQLFRTFRGESRLMAAFCHYLAWDLKGSSDPFYPTGITDAIRRLSKGPPMSR